MGFGYGHTTSHSSTARSRETGERVAQVFSGDMLAHVWAQRTQTFGRTSNGNFYFEGDALHSYGSHFLCAYLLEVAPGEVTSGNVLALHTLESSTVTTSGHCSAARAASRHLPGAWLPELTALREVLPTLAHYAGKPRQLARAAKTPDGWREARAQRVVRQWLDSFDMAAKAEHWHGAYDVDGVAVICRAAAIADSEVARIQSKRAKRLAAERAASDRRNFEYSLREAKQFAALSDSEFRASWPDDGARQWESGDGSKPYELQRSLTLATQLHKAARAASSKGWKRIAAEVRRKEKALRAHIAGRNDRIRAAYRKAKAQEILSWRAGTGKRPDSYRFEQFPAIKRALERAERKERAEAIAASYSAWAYGTGKRPALNQFEPGTPEFEAIAESIRRDRQQFELSARNWIAAPDALSSTCPELSTDSRYARLPEDSAPGVRSPFDILQDELRAEKRARAQREESERLARGKSDWLAGVPNGWRGDDGEGGALMRIRGDTLETSQGASVPLAHAVKVFRFVKACRKSGKSWRRNGATIRVGHFQVDSVDSSGNFVAGCHSFNWPEVERVARLAGVFELPPIDSPQWASA